MGAFGIRLVKVWETFEVKNIIGFDYKLQNQQEKLASRGLWAKHRGTHCSSRGSHQATKWSCRGPPGKRHKALFGFDFEDRIFKRSFTSLVFGDWMINEARSLTKHIVTLLCLLLVTCFVFRSLFCPFTQVSNLLNNWNNILHLTK